MRRNQQSYKRKVFLLIIFFSIFRIIVAASLELGNDESYYWVYSQHLKWNYFDHPPLVAIWTRIFTANLLLENYVVFLRLGSVVACALSSWFIFKCISALSDERAGWFGACLYNASFYAGITSGLFVMPDTPEMVFFTFSLWMLARITINEKNSLNWIAFGIASGICIMSKVHGVFVWVGLGLFTIFFKRNWLTNFRLYAALALALLIASPILIWNIKYNFETYHFQSARVAVSGFPINFQSFISEVAAQFFVNNPINFLLIIAAFFSWKKLRLNQIQALSIFNFIGLPLAFLLLFISLFRQTLPHWNGPAYVALIPLAAIYLSKINQNIFPKIIRWSLGIYVSFLIACTLVINFYPGTFGSKRNIDLGFGDLTLDMYGWKEAGKKFYSIYEDETSKKIMPKNAPVVCNKWWGAHIEYYFCRPKNIAMIGLGSMDSLHEYLWMNELRKNEVNLNSAYCIVSSHDYYDAREQYKNYYSKIDSLTTTNILRGSKPAQNFTVFHLSGWKNNLPTIK